MCFLYNIASLKSPFIQSFSNSPNFKLYFSSFVPTVKSWVKVAKMGIHTSFFWLPAHHSKKIKSTSTFFTTGSKKNPQNMNF